METQEELSYNEAGHPVTLRVAAYLEALDPRVREDGELESVPFAPVAIFTSHRRVERRQARVSSRPTFTD